MERRTNRWADVQKITTVVGIGILAMVLAACAVGFLNHQINSRERIGLISGAMILYWLFTAVIAPVLTTNWRTTEKKQKVAYAAYVAAELICILGIIFFLYGTGAGGGAKTGLAGAAVAVAAMKPGYDFRKKFQGEEPPQT